MDFNRENGESRENYIVWLFESNKYYIRNLLILYISFYPLFGILDYYSTSTTLYSAFNVRVFIGIPFLAGAFICTYIDKLKPYIRLINATALLAMNLSIAFMYASLEQNDSALDTYYSGLLITLATLGISMTCISIINLYVCISAISFIAISYFVHELHITNPFLFIRSTTYIILASGLFIVAGIVIERFSIKLYKAQNNITHEKDTISEQKDALKKVNDTKDRFFSIISHDLRSPFTSLIGYFDILLRNDKKEFKVKKDDIQKIYLHTRRTYNLLNNLLNWSKTQLNEFAFKPKQFKLNDIFSENDLLYQEIAHQKEIKITHAFPPNAKVYCDKEMIMTIIRNLIFNAIKFTKPRGEIYVTGTKISDNKMQIAVIDNGIGISDKDIEMILNPGVLHTKEGTYNEKGAGIGLIICTDLLKKHNTKMQIESRKNVGSKFFFELPIRANTKNENHNKENA